MIKKIKLHLGCGTVYLKGYINVEAPEFNHFWSQSDIRRAKKINLTTLSNYYKRRYNLNRGGCDLPRVADMYFDISYLKDYFSRNSVDEIVAYQVIEHFRQDKIENVMRGWHYCLKKGGILKVDVPDILATLAMIIDSDEDFDKDYILRLIYGSGLNKYCVHYNGFYPSKLYNLLKNIIGYKKVNPINKNIHKYPVFGFYCIK